MLFEGTPLSVCHCPLVNYNDLWDVTQALLIISVDISNYLLMSFYNNCGDLRLWHENYNHSSTKELTQGQHKTSRLHAGNFLHLSPSNHSNTSQFGKMCLFVMMELFTSSVCKYTRDGFIHSGIVQISPLNMGLITPTVIGYYKTVGTIPFYFANNVIYEYVTFWLGDILSCCWSGAGVKIISGPQNAPSYLLSFRSICEVLPGWSYTNIVSY